ncbi:hypothetical protein CF319_g8268 [Tilletia indica]|uniref:Uncharacterized protein n=1 Tax=Tilletia indica TaxID=43049 RepID=A0A177T794_9BASI|nr:hypothetical protein CF319_g8268 [Tilletia indica]KAE8245002.1 hypothetical protein A4X13_0g6131 [Tilletia indica]
MEYLAQPQHRQAAISPIAFLLRQQHAGRHLDHSGALAARQVHPPRGHPQQPVPLARSTTTTLEWTPMPRTNRISQDPRRNSPSATLKGLGNVRGARGQHPNRFAGSKGDSTFSLCNACGITWSQKIQNYYSLLEQEAHLEQGESSQLQMGGEPPLHYEEPEYADSEDE